MSASTPDPNPKTGADRARLWLWALPILPACWIVSALLHGGAIAGFALAPRAALRAAESGAGMVHATSARVRQVMRDLAGRQAAAAREKLAEMRAVRDHLAAAEAAKRAEVAQYFDGLSREPSARLREVQERIGDAQKSAAEKQAHAAPQTPGKIPEAQSLAAAADAQAQAAALQDRASEILNAAAFPEPVRAAQTAAREVQREAAEAGKEAAARATDLAQKAARRAEAEKRLAGAGTQTPVSSGASPDPQAGAVGEPGAAAPLPGGDAAAAAAKDAARQEADAARSEEARAAGETTAALDRARQTQASAAQAQAAANRASAEAMAQAAASGAGQAAAMPAPPAPEPVPDADANLGEVYDAAVRAEREIAALYRNVRAADLAMIRQIPVQEALAVTESAHVVRPDLARSLEKGAETPVEAAAFRETVSRAVAEIGAMAALADSMRARVEEAAGREAQGADANLEQMRARSRHAAAMAQLAAEDAAAPAKDLAGPMRAAAEGRWTGAAGGGGGGDSQGDAKPRPGIAAEPPRPPSLPRDLNAVPSRKLAREGAGAAFTFVDSWYVIGPWDNPDRRNIDTRFPPETIVDLDAVYTGKQGQPIRWEFQQTGEPMVMPAFRSYRRPPNSGEFGGTDYIIYYAYSEIKCDAPRDVWVAIGSDDFSKLWINDQLVWASGKEHKGWRADEGLRRVHLQAGVNRVLYRIENGHMVTAFSLVLCPKGG